MPITLTIEAVTAVRASPRVATHYYYIADASGNTIRLECSAVQSVALYSRDDLLVDCNHPLVRACSFTIRKFYFLPPEPLNPVAGIPRSGHRVDDMKRILADHDGGENAICRHGAGATEIATNACVIMKPAMREIHACRGQAHCGQWHIAAAIIDC